MMQSERLTAICQKKRMENWIVRAFGFGSYGYAFRRSGFTRIWGICFLLIQDGKPLEETDSIGDFARSEMNPQEELADRFPELTEQEDIPAQAEETASNGKNKKKKKNKKEKKEKEGGFWQKLSRIIFGEDDEEEKQAVDIGNTHRERMSVNFRRKTSRS